MKITFKTGFITGNLIGIVLVILGYFIINNMMNKAENISSFDLHQLEYQDLDGNKIQLTDYKDKHILVNFWATWCAPCIAEFPLLNETYDLVKDDFIFVMVSHESKEKIAAFTKDKPYNFIFLKSNNFLLEGITTVPQSFILDKNGNNIYHHPTIFNGNKEQVANILNQHLKKQNYAIRN